MQNLMSQTTDQISHGVVCMFIGEKNTPQLFERAHPI